MEKFLSILGIMLITALFAGLIFFGCTPQGREIWNQYQYSMHKTDEITYEQRKTVEDSCRAMISSWNFDILTYQQYKDADTAEKRSWSEQAKMRANRTAATYNEYILKNSYVWAGNIPADIYAAIDYIED
ncbi:MAG: hypothetical protein IJI57_04830 [Flexilinea sp.]|nr:hypothetical protein [Flexilinea sp.]